MRGSETQSMEPWRSVGSTAHAGGPLSVRRSLLGRAARCGVRYGEVARLDREFCGVEQSAGLGPVLGRQLDVAFPGPVGQHADDVPKAGLGVNPVESKSSPYPVCPSRA